MNGLTRETLRIIDANVNRLGEGLRVLEEFARMTLDDRDLTQRLKDLRHRTVILPTELLVKLLEARDSADDVGSDMNVTGVEPSRGIPETIIANSRRIQESLRVLEEIAKLPSSGLDSERFRQARFSIYTVEKDLIAKLGKADKLSRLKGLYVIIDAEFLRGRDPAGLTRAVIRGGANVIQYRDKIHGIRDILAIAGQVRDACRETGTLFIMNDSLETALAVDADGLHVGQDDMPVDVARRLLPANRILGCSVRTIEEAKLARDLGADHLGVGAMFATPTKGEALAVGPERLAEIKQEIDLPLVAIGGINSTNIETVMETGADAACVISAVLSAEDAEAASRGLVTIIKESV